MINLNKQLEIYNRNRTLILAVLATMVMIAYAQFVLGHFSNCFTLANGPNSLGLTFGYTQSQALSFFSARTVDQLICYGNFIRVWDTIFPVIYTAMYVFWLKYFFKQKSVVLFLPVIRMLTDWAENYTELTMLEQYLSAGNISAEIAYWGSMLTLIKWGLSILIYLLMVLGIVLKIKQALKKTEQPLSKSEIFSKRGN